MSCTSGMDVDVARTLDSDSAKIERITNVSLPGTEVGSRWDVLFKDGAVDQIRKAEEPTSTPAGVGSDALSGLGGLLAPSLCHPHIHLDKAFLLSHPRYAHLEIEKGDFQEAMTLTGQAKSQFEREDLLERGKRVIDESTAAGVTHMRAFVEIDAGVGEKCLEAGIELKKRAEKACHVQICAFAQLPLFSPADGDPDGKIIRGLMKDRAAVNTNVDVLGSTPYVEADRSAMEKNIDWMINLSIEYQRHLDFHLDYNLDPQQEPLVWHVIRMLKEKRFKERNPHKTIVLGHCTALTLFTEDRWRDLAQQTKETDLPISFVGLPTSDLFMMRSGKQPEVRGTLDIPRLVKSYGLNACIGINNIGNAFTPQGTCDPLSLACQGVGIYQASTKRDTEVLYECVSTRARAAIGLPLRDDGDMALDIRRHDPADLVLFPGSSDWKTRKSISEAVYLYRQDALRPTMLRGCRTRQ